jgi:hypothetical protein
MDYHLQRYTIAQFLELVNRDRVCCNERLAELKRKHSQIERFRDAQPLPMLRL